MGEERWEGDTTDDDLAALEAQFGQQEVVEYSGYQALPPTVPEVLDRDHVDLGVGGSLLEEADRIDATRQRPPLRRDPVLYAAVLVALVTMAGVVVAIGQPWLLAITILVVAAILMVGGLVFLMVVGRRGPLPEAELLRREARLEQLTARQLTLPPRWRLLYDRVLPGTEHRVPFLLVGPAGVLIATILPAGPYGLIQGGGVVAGDGDLNIWVSTRRWEVTELADRLANSTEGRWHFDGPVYSLALQARPPVPPARPGLTADPPRLIEGMGAIRKPPACRDLLASLPGVLPTHVVDDVEDQVNRLCLPAPSGAA